MAKPIKIIIDSGHYGRQNLSPYVPEYSEAAQMWILRGYLTNALESYGATVLQTRDREDTDYSKNASTAVKLRGARAQNCDLLISLHSNACNSKSIDRAVIINYIDAPHEDIMLANELGKSVTKVMELTQKPQLFTRTLPDDDTREYYGLLRAAKETAKCLTGIIIEHSFHTCPKSAKWLMNSDNLRTLAQAEADTIAKHYKISNIQSTKPINPSIINDTTQNDSAKKTLYRVQTGVFFAKDNATALSEKLKAEGFNTYLVFTGKHYKVGTYAEKENAVEISKKLKKAGYDNYILTDSGSTAPIPPEKPTEPIKKIESPLYKPGDKIQIAPLSQYSSGATVPLRYCNKQLTVRKVEAGKILIKELFSWIDNNYITPFNK